MSRRSNYDSEALLLEGPRTCHISGLSQPSCVKFKLRYAYNACRSPHRLLSSHPQPPLATHSRIAELVTFVITLLRVLSYAPPSYHADFRKDPYRKDHHARGRIERQHRECQDEDPGEGGYSSRPAAFDFRWKAARGRTQPF